MFNQYIKKFFQKCPVSTKFYEFYTQKNILESKNFIKLLVGKNVNLRPTIYFQTSAKDGPCEIFVGKNICHVMKIPSLFADVSTNKVTH